MKIHLTQKKKVFSGINEDPFNPEETFFSGIDEDPFNLEEVNFYFT